MKQKQTVIIKKNTNAKILLMRLDKLGDLILSLPAITSIKKAYPEAEVDLLISANLKEFGEAIDSIRKVYVLDSKKLKEFLSCISAIRKEKYDLAIDLMPASDTFSAVMLAMIRAEQKAGYAVGLRKHVVNLRVPAVQEMKFERDLVLDILKWIQIPTNPKIEVPFEKIQQKKKIKTVVFHPASSSDWRRHWPKEYYVEAIEILFKKENGFFFVFTGNEQEYAHIEEIRKEVLVKNNKINITNLAGKTTIRGLNIVMMNAAVIVSPLTGITHLAVAQGKSVITLVGPTPIARWTSPELPYIILKKEFACSPCENTNSCIYGKDNKCMKTIFPEEVCKRILEQVRKNI